MDDPELLTRLVILQGETLHRLARVLDRLVPADEATATGVCSHPTEARVDFGVTDGRPDWLCGHCGAHAPRTEE